MNDDIIEVQKLYRQLTADLMLSGVNPLLIAGVMNAQSVQMYELNMSDKNEYNKMIKIIYEKSIKE
tara:strand:- start:197 stop:394 length:198 start_codon:yes stop_codon:yes gene_type:complete